MIVEYGSDNFESVSIDVGVVDEVDVADEPILILKTTHPIIKALPHRHLAFIECALVPTSYLRTYTFKFLFSADK